MSGKSTPMPKADVATIACRRLAANPQYTACRVPPTTAVHERAATARAHEVEQGVTLFRRAATADDRHGQVLAHEPGDPLDGRSQAETRRDVLADPRGRGRGEGADRRSTARRDRVAEPPVVRAEVVAPARDAVRLVDDEAIDRQLPEVVEEAWGAETLGREVQEAKLAIRGSSQRCGAGRRADLTVHACGRDTERVEARRLVDHQRDQRRHHDREATTGDPRDPVG